MAQRPSLSVPAPGPDQSKIENPKSKIQRLFAYRILLILAVAVLILDFLTKAWISSLMPLGTYGEAMGAIPVIHGFFYLVHVGNPGAAWSIFPGQGVLLAVLAGATLVAIAIWRHALGLHARVTQICFGLLCGGIAGNLIDRLRYGYVVDFLDFHFGSYAYPSFNVADCGICVGVILYLLLTLREQK